MKYLELVKVYEELESNPSRLKKIEMLSEFIKKIKSEPELIYLAQGKIFPDYDTREIGISSQLAIKALSKASGIETQEIVKLWKKVGDLGLVAEQVISKRKQHTLSSKELTVEKVLENLRKLPDLQGKGTVDKKLALISELLVNATSAESKYLTRTLLQDLRIGVGEGTIRDSIVSACLVKEDPESHRLIQEVYDKTTDFAIVLEKACKGSSSLKRVELVPGKPVKVMLALKALSIEDGFKKVGKPAAIEYKYDGFRMMINKHKNEIKIFTRRLEEVTRQFPEVVEYIRKHIKADSFILDSEAVGYNPKTKKYTPFQAISQRIKRKHDIEKISHELPVELNVFDILYYNGESYIDKPFKERTALLRKIIRPEKLKIRTSEQIITSDDKEAERFYKEALKNRQEGIMFKALNAPYKPGARVGHMLKLKPSSKELDLVIVKAEAGTGKRAGWLSSYTVACRNKGKLVEIGKVSTGLKEKEEQGLSFIELTKKLKPLIKSEHGREVEVKPEVVVTVIYQDIQRSPTYESGFALRFPRITSLRPDRLVSDIATLEEVKLDFEKQREWAMQ